MAKISTPVSSTAVTLSPLARVMRTVLQTVIAFGAAMPVLIGAFGLTGVSAAKVAAIVGGIVAAASAIQNTLEHLNVLPTVGGKTPTVSSSK